MGRTALSRPMTPSHSRSFPWTLCLLTVGVFLVIKIPMLSAPNNPEELRDFDHYLRVSEGEKAYVDFVWIYGPLSPLLYGNAMKFFSPVVKNVRILSLSLWCVAVLFLTLLLNRYFSSQLQVFLAMLLCGGVLGYPSYSHNHVLVGTAMFASVYGFLLYMEKRRIKFAYFSFLAVLVALYTRPILMGYGLLLGWTVAFFYVSVIPKKDRLKHAAVFIALFLITLGGLYAYYGNALKFGFVPFEWTILPFKGYPNIHYLFPYHLFNQVPFTIAHLARLLRMSLETGLFYSHFFIWPVFLCTYVSLTAREPRKIAALFCMLTSVIASADLLHYGFTYPDNELALTVRGQYFISLTLVSFVLVLWPSLYRIRVKKLALCMGFGLLFLWAYFPWIGRAYHMARFEINPQRIPILEGIYNDPARSKLLQAARVVDEKCLPDEKVVIFGYFPGFRHLVKCQDPFEKDAYAFTRPVYYRFLKGENPYLTKENQRSDSFLAEKLKEVDPEFLVIENRSRYWTSRFCQRPHWDYELVGDENSPLRVCWKSAIASRWKNKPSLP